MRCYCAYAREASWQARISELDLHIQVLADNLGENSRRLSFSTSQITDSRRKSETTDGSNSSERETSLSSQNV